jgi:hypothetical protein
MTGEDVDDQRAALQSARLRLTVALDSLAGTVKAAARGRTDLSDVYGAVSAVRRAEEAHDLAALDLATAMGEDA